MRLENQLQQLSKPEHYVKVIRDTFRMRDALGRWFDYVPTWYQVLWHEKCILADPEAPNRLWWKCRGLGATACTMIDLLLLASTYDGLTIPISSITGKQAAMGPVKWGIELCDHTKIPGIIPRDTSINSMIRMESTGSIIFTIPGNSPQALRTYRSPALYYDEFDWCEQQEELLGAGEDVVDQDPSQISMVSTVQNVRGEFQRIIDNAEDLGYWVLKTPLFDWDETKPKTIDPTRSLIDQIAEGAVPIAPWVSMIKVERQRRRRVSVFLRENMCIAPDTGANFLNWELIEKTCTIPPFSAEHPYGFRGGFDKRYTMLRRPKGNVNHFTIGWDFARYHDLSVVEVCEFTHKGIDQVYEQTMRGSDTPTQNALLRLLNKNFKPVIAVRIDMTGSGQGLYDYAYKELGSKVDGINFASSMEIQDEKGRVKDAYALNLRMLMQDNKMNTFDNLELKDDMHSLPYDLKDAPRTDEGSHGDRFWALALAVWPPYNQAPFAFMA